MQFLFQTLKTEQMDEEIKTKEYLFCSEIVAKVSFIFVLKTYFKIISNWETEYIMNGLHVEILPFVYSMTFGTVIFINLLSR
jgi:hypothetical protein